MIDGHLYRVNTCVSETSVVIMYPRKGTMGSGMRPSSTITTTTVVAEGTEVSIAVPTGMKCSVTQTPAFAKDRLMSVKKLDLLKECKTEWIMAKITGTGRTG